MMSFPENDEELDRSLAEAFPPPPAADFDAWRRQHPQAVADLDPHRFNALLRRRTMNRIIVFAATAAAAAVAFLGLTRSGTNGAGASAFAQTLDQIQKARTVTWNWVFYEHIASEDGKSTWAKTHIAECSYKAPGLYREVRKDEKGEIERVEIKDYPRGRALTYVPKDKKATLEDIAPAAHDSGPFAYYREKLNAPNLQWIGKRKTATGEVNVFRNAFRDHDNDRDWSLDFWIDAKTKQLVAVYQPGADIYDPEKDPAYKNPPGNASSHHAMGGGNLDIRYDVPLDDSLFRLQPPEGYAVAVKQRDRVTEKEMIEYLGVLTEFNDRTFPDEAFSSPSLLSKMNRAFAKPKKDWTATEQKLMDTDTKYGQRFGTVTNAPVLVFFSWDPDSTVKNSFRYLGRGVKLGDKNAIVCWYKLKDAKDPNTYRVVYGDLSVKDVAPDDLPLPVEP